MTKEDFIAGKPFAVCGLPYTHIEFNYLSDSINCFNELKVSQCSSVILSNKDPVFVALLPVFGVVQCVTIHLSCCEVVRDG